MSEDYLQKAIDSLKEAVDTLDPIEEADQIYKALKIVKDLQRIHSERAAND